MSQPLVSVVTINYNDADGLRKTLESIAAQKSKRANLELIVVDGGSTDESGSVIDCHRGIIDQVISEPDKGIYDAMNKGLELANGDSIQFLNSGDRYFVPFNLAQFQQSQPLATKLVFSRTVQVCQSDSYFRPSFRSADPTVGAFGHPGAFVPKAVYKSVKFREEFSISADRIWLAEVSKQIEWVFCPEICAVFELGGVSSDPSWNQVKRYCKQPLPWTFKLKCMLKLPLRHLLGQRKLFQLLLRKKCDLIPTAAIHCLEEAYQKTTTRLV